MDRRDRKVMRCDTRKLILSSVSAALILMTALSLVCGHGLSGIGSETIPARAGAGSTMPSSSPGPGSPEVNAAAFKGQGRLAFVCQGLLYVLDGGTGEIGELTHGSVDMANSLGSLHLGPGRAASQPSWSPDGHWLAFRYTNGSQPAAESLWIMDNAGHVIGMTTGSFGQFSWSPAGNTLAVAKDDGLWLVTPNGTLTGDMRRLVPASASAGINAAQAALSTSFAWSPDGKTLAYSVTLPFDPKNSEGPSDALYTVAVDGGQPVRRLVTPRDGIIVAGWWPDGRGLLYWLDWDHSGSLKADGLNLYSLQLGNTKPKLLANGLTYPEWLSLSPRGRLLMVTGGDRMIWHNKSLAMIDVASGSMQELRNPAGCVALDPSLSADGHRIAFVAPRDEGKYSDSIGGTGALAAWVASRTLWIENADGSGAHPLTSAGQGIYQPLWSRDGSHILYVKDNSLWLIGADGGEPAKICGRITTDDLTAGNFGYYGFISYDNQMAWFQP